MLALQYFIKLGKEVGLEEESINSVLSSDKFGDAVRKDQQEAQAIGIQGVPFFVLNKTIKNRCDEAIHDIITEMKTNSKAVVSGTNLVIVLKHLERISEHCTNIAEYVHFMIHAKIIKHEKFDDKKLDS